MVEYGGRWGRRRISRYLEGGGKTYWDERLNRELRFSLLQPQHPLHTHTAQGGEFRENRGDGGLRLGLGLELSRSKGSGREKEKAGDGEGGGGGRGTGNALPSPGAEALAAAARGGGGWGEGTGERGVATVPAPAPRGWRGEGLEAGEGAGASDAPKLTSRSVVLGIPTVPRPQGVNYLEQTLQAVLAQVDQEVSDGPPEGGGGGGGAWRSLAEKGGRKTSCFFHFVACFSRSCHIVPCYWFGVQVMRGVTCSVSDRRAVNTIPCLLPLPFNYGRSSSCCYFRATRSTPFPSAVVLSPLLTTLLFAAPPHTNMHILTWHALHGNLLAGNSKQFLLPSPLLSFPAPSFPPPPPPRSIRTPTPQARSAWPCPSS